MQEGVPQVLANDPTGEVTSVNGPTHTSSILSPSSSPNSSSSSSDATAPSSNSMKSILSASSHSLCSEATEPASATAQRPILINSKDIKGESFQTTKNRWNTGPLSAESLPRPPGVFTDPKASRQALVSGTTCLHPRQMQTLRSKAGNELTEKCFTTSQVHPPL